MKHTNKNFKKQLDLLAHGRGRRQRLDTRAVPNNRKQILQRERERDTEIDLEDYYNVK